MSLSLHVFGDLLFNVAPPSNTLAARRRSRLHMKEQMLLTASVVRSQEMCVGATCSVSLDGTIRFNFHELDMTFKEVSLELKPIGRVCK